jgi:thiol-disulfide isomerase/thioredoxin
MHILVVALVMALMMTPQPPATAPRWRGVPLDLSMLDGGRVRTDTLAGRVVLLNLWASWRAPCRAELPALESLRREYESTDIVVLFVNEDRNKEAVREFMRREGLHFPTALGGVYRHERYGVRGLPATILLGRDGRELRRWLGYGGAPQMADIREAIRRAREGPP